MPPAEGDKRWLWRIGTAVLLTANILCSYLIGVNQNQASAKYQLWTTPPGWFFAIWGVIYLSLAGMTIYNLIKNEWSKLFMLCFGISNILGIVWIIVFGLNTDPAVIIASFLLLLYVPTLYKAWLELGAVSELEYRISTYIYRNIIAFYLGWIIAASNLSIGIILVYWWGVSKETQMIIFWILAPLCAVGATAANAAIEGKRGVLSCFCLWLSVVWAFAGAGITSNGCLNGTIQQC